MKKVLLVAAAVVSLAWGRTVLACSSNADCNPPTGGTNVCVCPDNSGMVPSPGPQCGSTTVIPGVLEIEGAADPSTQSVSGCIEIAETVGIGGSSSSPIVAPVVGTEEDCDAAGTAACLAGGCGVCASAGAE